MPRARSRLPISCLLALTDSTDAPCLLISLTPTQTIATLVPGGTSRSNRESTPWIVSPLTPALVTVPL